MEAFAQFGSDLDVATQKLLARGSRLTELLKQPQYSPLTVEDQVVVIFAGVNGYLDRVDIKDITRFEKEMLSHIKVSHKDIFDAIRTEQKVSDDTKEKLESVLADFSRNFA